MHKKKVKKHFLQKNSLLGVFPRSVALNLQEICKTKFNMMKIPFYLSILLLLLLLLLLYIYIYIFFGGAGIFYPPSKIGLRRNYLIDCAHHTA